MGSGESGSRVEDDFLGYDDRWWIGWQQTRLFSAATRVKFPKDGDAGEDGRRAGGRSVLSAGAGRGFMPLCEGCDWQKTAVDRFLAASGFALP